MSNKLNRIAHQVDVLILGGGPAGSAAGLTLLKRNDIKVMMVERSDYSEDKMGESLSSHARSSLEYLGVWDAFLSTQRGSAFHSKIAWGSDKPRRLGYMFNPNGAAWCLDRPSFDRMMASEFEKRGGQLLTSTQVTTCAHQAAGGWYVQLKTGQGEIQTVYCKYIIDASGRRGVMRTNLNLGLTVYDRLIGISCIAMLDADQAQKFQHVSEACEYGWWQLTPMAGHRVAISLMTDPDIANEMQACRPEVWRELLNQLPMMGELSRQLQFAEAPRSFPCYSSYLKGAGGVDWVAVGDAAVSYDPVASAGIPRALANGLHAAYIAVDGIFSKGQLIHTYAQALEQEFKQYLQTQWQIYQREFRWPNALFWARRRAVVGIARSSRIAAAHFYDQKIAPRSIHLKAHEMQDLWLCCTQGSSVQEILDQFVLKYRHIPEQKSILGIQELIETGFLDLAVDEGEDCVFFNTERLIFD